MKRQRGHEINIIILHVLLLGRIAVLRRWCLLLQTE